MSTISSQDGWVLPLCAQKRLDSMNWLSRASKTSCVIFPLPSWCKSLKVSMLIFIKDHDMEIDLNKHEKDAKETC